MKPPEIDYVRCAVSETYYPMWTIRQVPIMQNGRKRIMLVHDAYATDAMKALAKSYENLLKYAALVRSLRNMP